MLKRHLKTVKRRVDNGVANESEGKKVAEVAAGSVTPAIFQSQNRVKVPKKVAEGDPNPNGEPDFEIKVYDSFIIPYYEGSIRKTPRRSTLEKAKAFAEETAERLNKDGARADFLSEKDPRIYVLAKAAARKANMASLQCAGQAVPP